MTTYYIKKYGVHELHKASCVWLPIRKGMIKLGTFDTDQKAFEQASNRFDNVAPCRTCCKIDDRKSISSMPRR